MKVLPGLSIIPLNILAITKKAPAVSPNSRRNRLTTGRYNDDDDDDDDDIY
jgi:hypothetical protein